MERRGRKGKGARVIYLARSGGESRRLVRVRRGRRVVVVLVDACGSWVVSVDGEQAVEFVGGARGICSGERVDRLWPVAMGAVW